MAASYVNRILSHQTVDGEPTQLLLGNLIRQYQLLQDAKKHLDPKDRNVASLYEDELLQLREILPATNNILSMRDFWTKASRLVVTRNDLVRKLQS